MEGGFVLLALLVIGYIIIAPIVALARSGALASKVDELERELSRLRAVLSRIETRADTVRPDPAQTRPEAPPPPVAESIRPKLERLQYSPPPTVPPAPPVPSPPPPPVEKKETVAPPPPPPLAPPPPRPAPPRPAPQPARSRAEWEALIMTWFTRIGPVAILMGVAYFLQYSFAQGWIPPALQVLIGIGFGSGMLALGVYFYKKEADALAQALIAGGISILYLSVYAAFNLYDPPLIGQPVAFLAMAVVTAIAVVTAVKCDSLPVALLGLLGGFLTPLLLKQAGVANVSTGTGLFAYIALLDAGLLAVVVKKDKWAVVEPLALTATWITYFAWHADYSPNAATISITVPAVIAFFVLFYAMDVYRVVKSLATYPDLRMGMAVVNSVLFYIALYADLNQAHPHWMALATFLIAATYFATLLSVMRMHKEDLMVVPRYVVTAITLLVIATALQYNAYGQGYIRDSLWAAEALALVWTGLHWRMKVVWGPALALLGIALVAVLADEFAFGYTDLKAFHLVLNLRFLGYSSVTAAVALAAFRFRRSEDTNEAEIGEWLHYAWYFLPLVLFTVEINDFYNKLALLNVLHPQGKLDIDPGAPRYLTMAAVWLIYTIPIMCAGLWKKIEPMLNCGMITLVVAAGFMAFNAVGYRSMPSFDLFHNFRLQMIVLSMAVLFVQRSLLKSRSWVQTWVPDMVGLLDVCIALFGFQLLTLETRDAFDRIQGVYKFAPLFLGMFAHEARTLGLATVWAVYSILLAAHGTWRKSLPVFWVGIGVMALAFGAAVVGGTTFAPLLKNESYHLLINFRAGVLVFCCLAMLIHRIIVVRRGSDSTWANVLLNVLDIGVALLILELLTAETVDFFHTWNHELWPLPISNPMLRNLTLGVLWSFYSAVAVWYGFRRKSEELLVIGYSALIAGVSVIAVQGLRFERGWPDFLVIVNLRFLAFALLGVALLIHRRIAIRNRVAHTWTPALATMIEIAVAALAFELLTVEVLDYFRAVPRQVYHSTPVTWHGMYVEPARNLVLGALWALYSAAVAWYGFARKSAPMLVIGAASLAAAVSVVVVQGLWFDPAASFRPIANVRFAAFALLVVSLFVHRRLLGWKSEDYPWSRKAIMFVRVLVSLLIFELVSVETWAYFDRRLSVFSDGRGLWKQYKNLQQMWLSVMWVIFSFCLMIYGIARRIVPIRFVALGVFAITILKVFLSDLSFLQTLYRIFSFFALGLILLATAYLYRRFRDSILDVDEGGQ